MTYDDASWHSGGEYPKSSPVEYGGTHIGLFLRWCFVQGWAGAIHQREAPHNVRRVIDGEMTGTEFLFTFCAGAMTPADLNEAGNAFAEQYYGMDGFYLNDYEDRFGPQVYAQPETSHNFEAFSTMIDARRRSGLLSP